MPISTPDNYANQLARKIGPFYTQGLPDDTKALEEGVFSDDDYVSQSNLVLAERLAQFRFELERFQQTILDRCVARPARSRFPAVSTELRACSRAVPIDATISSGACSTRSTTGI